MPARPKYRPRWMKFYPSDYESDPALRVCSLAAQGLWMRLLCLMHAGTPAGHLTVNGRPVTPEMTASIIGVPASEIKLLLAELSDNGVYSISEKGVIFSRRIVSDQKVYAAAVKNGKKGGNPEITKTKAKKNQTDGVNPRVNPMDNAAVKPGVNLERERERERESTLFSLDSASSLNEADVNFQAWWNIYDKKRGRQEARKQFSAALKKADVETIMTATSDYVRQTPQIYRLDPERWLKREKWADELGSIAKANRPSDTGMVVY
jgi:hypothetical protein